MAAPPPLPRPVLRPVTGPGHPLLVAVVEHAGKQHLREVVAHATFDPERQPAFKFLVDDPDDPDFYCCCVTQQDTAFAMLERIAELEREQQAHTTRIQAEQLALEAEEPQLEQVRPGADTVPEQVAPDALEQLAVLQQQLEQAKAEAGLETRAQLELLQRELLHMQQQVAAAQRAAGAAQGENRTLEAQVQVLQGELQGARAELRTQQVQGLQAAAQRDILEHLYRHQATLQPISAQLAQLRCNLARQRATSAPQEQSVAAAAFVLRSTWQVQQGSGVPVAAASASPRVALQGQHGQQAPVTAALAALAPMLFVQLQQAKREVARLQEARRPVDDNWMTEFKTDFDADAVAAAEAAVAAAAGPAAVGSPAASEIDMLMVEIGSDDSIMNLFDKDHAQGAADAPMGEQDEAELVPMQAHHYAEATP